MDLQSSKSESTVVNANCSQFLSDPVILKIVTAIFVSTIAMATLEPCLPIWLMGTTHPEVCTPSTIGYNHNCSDCIRFLLPEMAVWHHVRTRFTGILCEHELFCHARSSRRLHAYGDCFVVCCWHFVYLGKFFPQSNRYIELKSSRFFIECSSFSTNVKKYMLLQLF